MSTRPPCRRCYRNSGPFRWKEITTHTFTIHDTR
jgi:hypothetical protein